MTLRRITWLGVLVLAGLAVLLSHSWLRRSASARARRIVVETDAVDATRNSAQTKAEYDPLFVRVNHSADFVFSATNLTSRSQ